jgi:hypothetical protein
VLYKSFHLYDVEFDLCRVLSVLVFHLSLCEVTVVRFDVVVWARFGMVETARIYQVMWFVMLESAKDRVIGVDTSGQQMPPHVRYGTTCLLIRYAISCVSCSVEWGCILSLWSVFVTLCVNCLNHMVQKGYCVRETSSLQARPLSGNRSKTYHTPIVNLCNGM